MKLLSLLGSGGSLAAILATAPWVAQWKFNNNGNDSVGSNTLTNNNSATFTTGLIGGATGATQLVSASSQYWSAADNAALSTGDVDFTISGWVYLDTVSASQALFAKRDIAGAGEYFCYYFQPSAKFVFEIGDGTAGQIIHSTTPIATATWYFVSAWHDSVNNQVGLQINTTAETAATSGAPTDTTQAFQIGHWYSGNFHLNGRMDNVCFAKSAASGGGVLTAAQRTALYNGGNGTEVIV